MLLLRPRSRLVGSFRPPGDKSVSHRALILGTLALGESHLRGLGPGDDVRTTREILNLLGATIEEAEGGSYRIRGGGWSGLDRAPGSPPIDLDCRNSGTTARLLLGLLVGRRGAFRLMGDSSLSGRPMARVVRPLRALGARIDGEATLPLTVEGGPLRGSLVDTGTASAQVKSALLLAALQAEGESLVREATETRDHTERLLLAMGAPLRKAPGSTGALLVGGGCARLKPLQLSIPGDPSSAAFAIASACLLEGSDVTATDILVNPRRMGFFRLLQRMGARVSWTVDRDDVEPVGSIRAVAAPLTAIDVGAEEIVDAIDELPLLAVVATRASGTTRIRGASELRHKESDRIMATVALLRSFGADAHETKDGLVVQGGRRLTGAEVDARGDHRIAMAAAVLAATADDESRLSGAEWIAVSYPGFVEDLDRLTC